MRSKASTKALVFGAPYQTLDYHDGFGKWAVYNRQGHVVHLYSCKESADATALRLNEEAARGVMEAA